MLKVCFLNIWGGRRHWDFARFAEDHKDVDVWCFTEVNSLEWPGHVLPEERGDFATAWEWDGLMQLEHWTMLSDMFKKTHTGWFSAATKTKLVEDFVTKETYENVAYGDATLYRKDISLATWGECNIFPGKQRQQTKAYPRNMSWVILVVNGKRYLIAHFHGIWIKGATKSDHPGRITQSVNVLSALQQIVGNHKVDHVVLGGDFNLSIETQALGMLENGTIGGNLSYRNLIREFVINDTRTPLYRNYNETSHYADYVLVSREVEVHSFEAPAVAVSDHRPLIVEFS